jgi:ABC-type amino acid transport substrate-binding protein
VTRWIPLALISVALAACVGPREPRPPKVPPLVVGMAAETPPLTFRRGGELVGIEVDFALALGEELGRPVRLVDLEWDHLFGALLHKRVDIVMSGMTITPARKLRVAFTDPYLQSGVVALVRRREVDKYATKEKLLQSNDRVGFRINTTGEKFVAESMRFATRSGYRSATDAALELAQQRIDIFVSDAPVVAWLVSTNEADLAAIWTPLTNDQLAWAVRPDDDELRTSVNDVLARWKADGTLRAILQRWLHGMPGLWRAAPDVALRGG